MKRDIYIALENKNLSFTPDEVEAFEWMWNSGSDLTMIAKNLKRTKVEVLVLLLDRADKKKIQPRGSGIFESCMSEGVAD